MSMYVQYNTCIPKLPLPAILTLPWQQRQLEQQNQLEGQLV